MLELENIKKDYVIDKSLTTHALKGISLTFKDKGFVAILGHSGCGKTTLLNIISGLDRYTDGDLVIDGVSTKEYNDRDWDDYRNKKIGIIFQSYNLIPHLNILENTELALTLSGISNKEKRERALEALRKVGLEEQAKKRPNQLSGGQQQRVAIARAIVSNPLIILADEPTGALDTETSTQVMDILAKIAQDHLVLMVTHNKDLAFKYADRIIHMSDGLVLSDSVNKTLNGDALGKLTHSSTTNVSDEDAVGFDDEASGKSRKSRMSFLTALKMSLKNLMTKKGRTIATSVASSFGIIGVGLVLAISNGFSDYVKRIETESLAQFPISVEGYGLATSTEMSSNMSSNDDLDSYPSTGDVTINEPTQMALHTNNLDYNYYQNFLKGGTDAYGRSWQGLDSSLYSSIQNNYAVNANVIAKSIDDDGNERYSTIDTSSSSLTTSLLSSSSSYWNELPGDESYITTYYDILPGGRFPTQKNEVMITVDRYNRISTNTLKGLGINPAEYKNEDGTYKTITLDTFNDMEFKLVPNDVYYEEQTPTTDSPIFYGIGLRGAIDGGDNKYTFPNFLSYMSSSSLSSESTREEMESYVSGLLDFFFPTDAEVSLSLRAKFAALMDQVRQESDTKEQARMVAEFLNDNSSQIERETGAKLNLISSQLSTYVSPQSNEDRKQAFEDSSSQSIKIVGVLRIKESTQMSLLDNGIYYLPELTNDVVESAKDSQVAKVNDKDYFFMNLENVVSSLNDEGQLEENEATMNLLQDSFQAYNILSYDDETKAPKKFGSVSDYSNTRKALGTDSDVDSVTIYPIDFDKKEEILKYLDLYNTTAKSDGTYLSDSEKIIYIDVSSMMTEALSTLVDVISIVLICFASISLVVSSVMIGIIIYVSVIERTKEIGILRSVGARKKDVGRLFKMESVSIGFMAGVIGVVITYLLSIPVNIIVNNMYPGYGIGNIAALNPLYAILLIVISSLLTYISGLFPSRSAAKKNPVKCLRASE